MGSLCTCDGSVGYDSSGADDTDISSSNADDTDASSAEEAGFDSGFPSGGHCDEKRDLLAKPAWKMISNWIMKRNTAPDYTQTTNPIFEASGVDRNKVAEDCENARRFAEDEAGQFAEVGGAGAREGGEAAVEKCVTAFLGSFSEVQNYYSGWLPVELFWMAPYFGQWNFFKFEFQPLVSELSKLLVRSGGTSPKLFNRKQQRLRTDQFRLRFMTSDRGSSSSLTRSSLKEQCLLKLQQKSSDKLIEIMEPEGAESSLLTIRPTPNPTPKSVTFGDSPPDSQEAPAIPRPTSGFTVLPSSPTEQNGFQPGCVDPSNPSDKSGSFSKIEFNVLHMTTYLQAFSPEVAKLIDLELLQQRNKSETDVAERAKFFYELGYTIKQYVRLLTKQVFRTKESRGGRGYRERAAVADQLLSWGVAEENKQIPHVNTLQMRRTVDEKGKKTAAWKLQFGTFANDPSSCVLTLWETKGGGDSENSEPWLSPEGKGVNLSKFQTPDGKEQAVIGIDWWNSRKAASSALEISESSGAAFSNIQNNLMSFDTVIEQQFHDQYKLHMWSSNSSYQHHSHAPGWLLAVLACLGVVMLLLIFYFYGRNCLYNCWKSRCFEGCCCKRPNKKRVKRKTRSKNDTDAKQQGRNRDTSSSGDGGSTSVNGSRLIEHQQESSLLGTQNESVLNGSSLLGNSSNGVNSWPTYGSTVSAANGAATSSSVLCEDSGDREVAIEDDGQAYRHDTVLDFEEDSASESDDSEQESGSEDETELRDVVGQPCEEDDEDFRRRIGVFGEEGEEEIEEKRIGSTSFGSSGRGSSSNVSGTAVSP